MVHGDIRPGDCFILGWDESYDDVYVVIDVSPVVDEPDHVCVTYAFLHELGQRGSFSAYTASLSHPVDGEPLFERRT